MKYRLTFKDPDCSIEAATGEEIEGANNLPDGIGKWLEYYEYVTVQWDSKTNEMSVVPVDETQWKVEDMDEMLLQEALSINTHAHLRALGVVLRSELIEVPGSGSALHSLRLYTDAHHWCSCQSFTFERGLDDDGNCKHIRATIGSGTKNINYELVKDDDDVPADKKRFHDWTPEGDDGEPAEDA